MTTKIKLGSVTPVWRKAAEERNIRREVQAISVPFALASRRGPFV